MRVLPLLLLPTACAFAIEPSYIGSAACSGCHRNIAASQSKSKMALTWQSANSSILPAGYLRKMQEGDIAYQFSRTAGAIQYQVSMPAHEQFRGKVETIVGGTRHGLSFLVRVPEIDGIKLPRAPLVETRYLHYAPSGALVLSPGFPEERPSGWETAIGRVLSPDFEQKCLNCHGAAEKPSHETGVRCETCHGAGSAHVKAVAAAAADKAILNPKRLDTAQQMELCSRCHAGFSDLSDPVPDDVLISNQVTALKKSQCYIQSGAAVSCVSCHNPHHDSPKEDPKAVATCLSCHSPKVESRAALCPVNKTGKCLQCHMPEARKGSFHMADHWIRVHPEQGVKTARHDPADRTHVRPRRLYLRWIVNDDKAKADAAHAELAAGAPFFSVAQKYSTDSSAISGGFLGDMAVGDMDPTLAEAALKLERGGSSNVLAIKGRPTIIHRMPRDFLYEAEQIQLEANRLREKRKFAEAAGKYLESLQVYPYYLRSLIFLAVSVGEQGDGARATGILEFAARLYPNDPAAQYNLGIAYGSIGRSADELRAYQRAIDLEPDLIPAYLNLGSAHYTAGRLDRAAEVYQRGLTQNPLDATLYFNLAQVYQQQGKNEEAARALALAAKIDPKFATVQK